MATQIDITFNPAGFAECLSGMSDMVKSIAEELAEKAEAESGAAGSYTVTVKNEPRFHDAQYGVARPIARAIPVGRVTADSRASADEAENKSMSKAVGG